jgi:hypothetical protein
LLHTSAATSTAELFVDTSFYDEHGAIYDAVIKRGDNDPESVTWTDIVGCHVDSDTAADGQESAPGSDLQNASRTSAWNAGAASEQMLGDAEDGYVECVADGSQTTRMLGFSAADTNVSYASIHYGFYLHPTGWTIYEKGVQMGVLGTYAQGDRLKVQRQSGVIRYMKNDEMVYESLVPSDTVLVVDTALYSPAAALHDVQIGGPDRVVEPVIWTNLMNVIVDDDHVSE